jgi:hypothetical protein
MEAAHMRRYEKIAGCAGLANENMLVTPGDVGSPGLCRDSSLRGGNVTAVAHAAQKLPARIYIICVAALRKRAAVPEEIKGFAQASKQLALRIIFRSGKTQSSGDYLQYCPEKS